MRGLVALVLSLACLLPAPSCADQAQDCKELCERAAAMFKEQGTEAALKAIDDRGGPFVKGELYVFAISMDNVILAHPVDKSIKRMRMQNMKDSSGKEFFKEFKDVALNRGSGFVEYTWAKPGENEPALKRSYIMKVPEEDIYIGAGYYVK